MSEIQAPKRLAKVATELNQSKDTIIAFLKAKGLSIENNPNARLDNEQYNVLVKEFQTDKILKDRAEKELNRLKDEVNENSEKVTNAQDSLEIQNLSESDSLKVDEGTQSHKEENQDNIIEKRKRPRIERGKQNLEKKAIVIGSELELEVSIKVPPGFLFFNLDNGMQGSLHVSELNWNFGLSQSDFRSIQVGSTLRVYVIGFDDRYKKVHLSRKNLKTIERPSRSLAWSNLILHKEISATVFEEFRNKVIVELDLGLFATIPLLEGKFYQVGTKVQVIPIRKRVDQNIIECTLRELVTSSEEQGSEVIESFKEQKPENNFSTSEFCLNSYQQLSESLYWNYFSKEEQELLKLLFEETESLFSKVDKGSKAIYIEFDFDFNAYNDFTRNIAPSIFDFEKLPTNFTDKDLLLELSKFNFWYTQFEQHRRTDGAEQNIIEKTFTLFNEMISIRGIVSECKFRAN